MIIIMSATIIASLILIYIKNLRNSRKGEITVDTNNING